MTHLPSVDHVVGLVGGGGGPRRVVVAVVREHLAQLREAGLVPAEQEILAGIRQRLADWQRGRIVPVINATGILIHTNLGRAPLGDRVAARIAEVARGYCALEIDLDTGRRGLRAPRLERLLALLFGAPAATVVNNNAAALVLIVQQALAAGKAAGRGEVLISRGELVQIGGGFRVPEILEAAGAVLREVGTTNRTDAGDYRRAISARTALLLRVHRSNFAMEGFVASPQTAELSAIAREAGVPLAVDLGSGATEATRALAAGESEPTADEALAAGADLVCVSGDKLLGGTQAGIILGGAALVATLKKHPLFRALRCGKLALAGLEAVAEMHLTDDADIPLVQMIRADNQQLRTRAETIIAALGDTGPLRVAPGTGEAQMGGGALPRTRLDSVTLDLTHAARSLEDLAAALRQASPPIIGYLAHGVLKLDLRTILLAQDALVLAALRQLASLEPDRP